MEHAQALPEPPCVQSKATEEERADVRQLLSPNAAGRNLGLLLTRLLSVGKPLACAP